MAHQRIPIDLAALFAPQSPTFESLPQWYDLGGHCSSCEREGWVDHEDARQAFLKAAEEAGVFVRDS